MGSSSRRRQKTSTSSTSRGRRSASTSSRPSTPSSSRRCAAGFTHSSEARCALVSVLRSMRSSLASSLVGALASVTHTHLHARAHPRTRYCSLSLTDTRLAHTSLCMHCAHTRYLHLHLQARTHTCSRRTGGERPADLEALDGGPVPRVCKVQGQRRRLGRLPLDDPRHQEAGEQRVNCNRRREPCSTCSTCLPCSICSICSAYILLLTSFFAHLTSCSPHLTARLTSCSPHLLLASPCALPQVAMRVITGGGLPFSKDLVWQEWDGRDFIPAPTVKCRPSWHGWGLDKLDRTRLKFSTGSAKGSF